MKTFLSLLLLLLLVGCSLTEEQPVTNIDGSSSFPTSSSNQTLVSSSPSDLKPATTPSVTESSTISESPKKLIRPESYSQCGANSQAQELAQLIATDSEQQRLVINCNAKLAEIAAIKAQEMAVAGEVSHKGRFDGPNNRLAFYGVRLPSDERLQFNTVEAVAGGEEFADDVWLSFQTSYPHRTHLLAEHDFYLGQTELGVGYARNLRSPHLDYWVVYFAKLSK